MDRDELCVCGHPQSSHRTYGCTTWRPNPDPKKTDRIWCQCKGFQSKHSPSRDLKFVKRVGQ
jgi:hypothetical protein